MIEGEAQLYCATCGAPASDDVDRVLRCRAVVGRDQLDDRPIECGGRRFTTARPKLRMAASPIRVSPTRATLLGYPIEYVDGVAPIVRQRHPVDGEIDGDEPRRPFVLTERDKILLVHAGILSAAAALDE